MSLGYSESKFITSVDISSENECSGDEDNTRITAEVASEPHTSDDAIKMDDNQTEVPEPINTETGEVTDSEKIQEVETTDGTESKITEESKEDNDFIADADKNNDESEKKNTETSSAIPAGEAKEIELQKKLEDNFQYTSKLLEVFKIS